MDLGFLLRAGLVVITGAFIALGVYGVFFGENGLLGSLLGG